MTDTDRENIKESVIATDGEQLLRKMLYMLLAPEAILIFKKAQFAGAKNMLTKG